LVALKNRNGPYADFQGQTAKQIYQGGKQALAKKKYQKAIKSFEALDALYPYVIIRNELS